jgi:ribosome maturation factor RimP
VVACPRRRVEERLTNINEAMLLDSSKPGLEQDINSKSLFERQIDLAANIQKLSAIGKDKQLKKRRQGKNAGEMSRAVIDSQEANTFVSDIRTIVVRRIAVQCFGGSFMKGIIVSAGTCNW